MKLILVACKRLSNKNKTCCNLSTKSYLKNYVSTNCFWTQLENLWGCRQLLPILSQFMKFDNKIKKYEFSYKFSRNRELAHFEKSKILGKKLERSNGHSLEIKLYLITKDSQQKEQNVLHFGSIFRTSQKRSPITSASSSSSSKLHAPITSIGAAPRPSLSTQCAAVNTHKGWINTALHTCMFWKIWIDTI